MGRRTTAAAGLLLAVLLVAVAAVVGLRWWDNRDRTDLQQALGYAPTDTVRFSWTDWAAVRARLHADLDQGSSVAQVQAFLDKGYDADLTSGSAMVDSTPILQDKFGFSPADVDWELLSQGDTGSVLTLGLPDSLSIDHLGDTFAQLGYTRPDTRTGVWMGGDDLLARIRGHQNISPQFNYLALDPDRHLLLASDSAPYLREAVGEVDDDKDPGGDGLAGVADAVGEPLSAELYTGDYACQSLAMAQADPDDVDAGEQLVTQAGGVNPLDGFAMASEPDHQVLVAMSFESDDAARHNADSRAALASGPAPGQGGDFSDRFNLGKVTADGKVVTMQLHPVEGSSVLSDLSTGPVLFATC